MNFYIQGYWFLHLFFYLLRFINKLTMILNILQRKAKKLCNIKLKKVNSFTKNYK